MPPNSEAKATGWLSLVKPPEYFINLKTQIEYNLGLGHLAHDGKTNKDIEEETENESLSTDEEQNHINENFEIEKVSVDISFKETDVDYGWFVYEDDFEELFPPQIIKIKKPRRFVSTETVSKVKKKISSLKPKKKIQKKSCKEVSQSKDASQSEDETNLKKVRSIFDGIWL
mmetsp:Transcript_24154/g.31545  ORF Transcript_24154/g.31545 Transcript_24154/m.31545 type:complete len:172 (+) Transcript_24154:89-604(+)